MLKAVICLSGLDTEEFLGLVLSRLLPQQTELELLYVVDTRPAEELGYTRRPHLFSAGTHGGRQHRMEEADLEVAQQVLEESRQFCVQSGWQQEAVRREVRRGRPEREIVVYADEIRADLIVIGVRYKGGPVATTRGPASIGPVARYVIDHSACDLLVIKGAYSS
jgi:nucleotide-binding universal stress UspA family protein